MATSYIALLRKEKGSDYGVEFPDFPGCATAGRTLEAARRAAREALELHLEGMAAEELPVPEPSSLDAIFASDWETRGAIPFLVTPEEPETKVVRVNVTFKPAVLKALDGYAKGHQLTRAAALETAVRRLASSKSSVKSPRRSGAKRSARSLRTAGRQRTR